MTFQLNKSNLKDIPFDKYSNDFTFIVNGKRYETSRFLADILSPYLRKLHYSNNSINEFSINTTNNKTLHESSYDYFSEFLNLVTFDEIQVDLTRRKYFSEYFFILGNFDEYMRLNTDSDLQSINNGNRALDQLIILTNILQENTANQIYSETIDIKHLIETISNNFDSCDKDKMKELKVNFIEDIIQNPKFQVDSEDSLFDFVFQLYLENRQNGFLFEYVYFNNISIENLEKFIHHFDIEYLNVKIWESICNRFLSINTNELTRKRYKIEKKSQLFEIKEIKYSNQKEFNGILNFLSNETHENIHDNKTIEITTNSLYNNDVSRHPKNLVDFDKGNWYSSGNDLDTFICFDFKEKSIQLTNYTIKSNTNVQQNGYHLRNWVIEVSNDNLNWTVIDSHRDNKELAGESIVHTFDVEVKKDDFYRYVRLRQTGPSWGQPGLPNHFWICCVEFYGKLKYT